ncbi:helix-turn-helix domain-containing protein [Luteibacter aegosomatissinici]|uniref:helix-turn-helix domain-containing protein n=1 Tax=Luteibacter aegosomatissinici TaxID=2911539 RepID=UPI001FF76387|nr:AraC family transcriptional regulator [Luteibacter aegosomatissinici]UPG92719.1 AraC family transcriptional regulator [Luteibacter aegosomatissinici]
MVIALIEESFGRPLSGDEMAASVGLSKGAFHRAFKATFGLTPFRYLTRKRVEAAARLMLATNLNLGAIAADAGFYDQAHLCRQFRKVFGESPDRWRRRQRERCTGQRVSG